MKSRYTIRTLLLLNVALALTLLVYRWNRLPPIGEIRGVKLLNDGEVFDTVQFEKDAPRTAAANLIDHVAEGERIWFYDPEYESPSDPGAFVTIARRQHVLLLHWQNHGWSTSAISVQREEAIDYLWAVRRSNQVGVPSSFGEGDMNIGEDYDPSRLATGPDEDRLRRQLQFLLVMPRDE